MNDGGRGVILPALVTLAVLWAGNAAAADLRITDAGGTTVVVRNAVLDYGALMSDNETQGIRVQQGDGTVLVRWASIGEVTLVPGSPAVKLELVLKNGQRASVTLIRKGRMKLTGMSDLGDYSIDIDKIRRIAPI